MKTSADRGDERSCRDVLRHLVIGLQVGAADLDIDGRGRSHVDHRVDQAAGGEVGREFRHFLARRSLMRAMYS